MQSCFWYHHTFAFRDLSEISEGGGGGGNRERVTTFWDSEKGGVMKKGEGHANICPWTCRGSPTEEKVSSLVKKREKKEQQNIMDINCEVLLQEYDKHPPFIYNNARESYWNYE